MPEEIGGLCLVDDVEGWFLGCGGVFVQVARLDMDQRRGSYEHVIRSRDAAWETGRPGLTFCSSFVLSAKVEAINRGLDRISPKSLLPNERNSPRAGRAVGTSSYPGGCDLTSDFYNFMFLRMPHTSE